MLNKKESKNELKKEIKSKIEYLRRKAIIRQNADIISYILTPIVTRAHFSKNNNPDEWLRKVSNIDIYNSIIDEINNELKINDNILQKIYNQDELQDIQMGLVYLPPTSIYYSNIIEELIRKSSMRQKKYMPTQNMLDVVSNFSKSLNINDSCIELGSGLGCFLREENSNFNIIKGIEKDEYLNDISKLLNLMSGNCNIELKTSDVIDIDESEKYSLTILEPQRKESIRREEYRENTIVARNSRELNSSDLLLEKAINLTKDGGYILAIVNDGILFSKYRESIRNLIINKTTIKAIVALPNHIQKPYNVVNMSIMIMEKKTNNFNNHSKLFISEINKIDEISEVSNKFAKFMQNNLDDSNLLDYSVLHESDNWTAKYLSMFRELNSSNRYLLNELCYINLKGIKKLTHQKEKYPYIEVKNIDTDRKILDNIKEVEYSELSSRAKLLAYPGDIVISTVRPDKGAVAIVPNDHEVYIVSSALAVLTPKNISSELLYFILSSNKVTQELAALASGTSVPMIMKNQLKEYSLPISNIPNQYEEEAKDLYKKLIIKYTQHQTLNQIIDEELKNIDESDIKEYTIDKVINYRKPVVLKDNKEVKQVKIVNLNSESLYVNESELDVFEEKEGRHNLINNKDILIPRILDSIGRTSMADISIDGCISNHLIYTYSTNDIVLPEYIAILFRSSEVKARLKDLLKDSKRKDMIKREVLQSIVVKLPKLEIQKNIVDKILNKSKSVSLNEILIEKDNFEDKLV